MFSSLIERWAAHPLVETFPLRAVTTEVMRVGKHFLDEPELTALDGARQSLPRARGDLERRELLARLLDVLLDKADGRYDYLTYTAMPLFPITGPAGDPQLRRDRTVALLVADLLAFEIGSMDDPDQPLPQMRPDHALIDKRCRLALRASLPAARRAGIASPSATEDGADIATARELVTSVFASATAAERELLELTMQPVYTIHDEHMFLRVLQSFEATFVLLAERLRGVIDSLQSADVGTAADLLRGNDAVLHEAGLLFSLLATMKVTSFRTFRTYTEGASAIQSEGYKTVESLCRRPDPERLASLPYNSVPKVQARIHSGQMTVQEVADAVRPRLGPEDSALLAAAMADFEDALVRWRRTHHSVAVRMLGDATGSGYSEGTPYLKSVIHLPVFDSASGSDNRQG